MNRLQSKIYKESTRGDVLTAILIIAGAFIIVIYGLLFILSLQFDFSNRQTASEEAIHMSEAGVNYYRWHLAHDPSDFTDGTGNPGPYEHDYLDPQGASIGKFSLNITPPSGGSSIVTIRSTGWSNQFPKIKRTIKAQYGQPSLAQFAFLQNNSAWYGTSITAQGKVHSNNGVRMDGTNTSLVTSAKETYTCGSETGCNPPQSKPGVWGAGGDQGLWQFPVPRIDFNTISFNFTSMRQEAQTNGLYLGPSGRRGYHLLFLNDGTVKIYRVKRTNNTKGYSLPGQGTGKEAKGGCQKLNQVIKDENLIGTYNLSEIPLIYAEDYLWVEGTVAGRVTVIAARFPLASRRKNMNIWIRNNLTYSAYDGTSALGLIAQNDIYFTRDTPEDFKVDAILMAQSGKIIRHGYLSSCGSSSEAVKDSLTINGSVISYYKSYWNYGSEPLSGFEESNISYDTNLLYNPPPYFPTIGQFEFISWIEE